MLQSPFVFRGGHLCLDFLNTEIIDSEGRRSDLLQRPSDLAAWLYEANVEAAEGERFSADSPDCDPQLLENTRRFRAAMRELVAAVTEKRDPAEAARVEFNAVLRLGAGYPQLYIEQESLARGFTRVAKASEIPPTLPIAEAALELLTGEEAKRIRRCESQDCILYFLDTSKNHSRRWCSMEACGNRHKAAAHYLRRRNAKTESAVSAD